MKRNSIGKGIALALAAIAIGFVVWVIWGLFLPATELVDKVFQHCGWSRGDGLPNIQMVN